MGSDELEAYDFGMRLKLLREECKLTQKQFAERIGVSKNTVYEYESNTKSPQKDKLPIIARTLNTSTDYLLGLEDEPTIRLAGLTERQRRAVIELVHSIAEEK